VIAVLVIKNFTQSHGVSDSGARTAPEPAPKPSLQPAPTNPDEKAVYELINALQAGDFKSVVDLTAA
jgi:hypothetical protein